MILGNIFSGSAVQANVIISKLLASGELDESGRIDPGVSPVCAVAHTE